MIRLILFYFLWLRFQMIDLKPVHHDEAINGLFIQNLWNYGFYRYDPSNYHGPLLIYLMGLSEKLFGWGIESIRAVPIIFSAIWLWFLYRWAKQRFSSSRWMTLVFASSCAFLFFSRSGIHEMVFVFFMTLALAGVVEVLDYRESKGWVWLLWGVWGAICLKETWALIAVAGGLAIILSGAMKVWRTAKVVERPRNLWAHLTVAAFLWAFLYSQGFSNMWALTDFFKAFMPWTQTGVHGAGHNKSFFYWLSMISRYELPLLLLWLCAMVGFVRNRKYLTLGAQFLGWGSLLQFVAYSAVPYKTPWCLLAVLGPICLFLMVAWKQVVVSWTLRSFIKIAVLIAALLSWSATSKLNFKTPTMEHDYVYVQTAPQLKVLIEYILDKAKDDANLTRMRIQVAGTESWPMAWWMTPFSNMRFAALSAGLIDNVDFLIVDASETEPLEKVLPSENYYKFVFPIRGARVDSAYYLRKSLFPEFPVDKMENPTQ